MSAESGVSFRPELFAGFAEAVVYGCRVGGHARIEAAITVIAPQLVLLYNCPEIGMGSALNVMVRNWRRQRVNKTPVSSQSVPGLEADLLAELAGIVERLGR